jgi:hypothetical protein
MAEELAPGMSDLGMSQPSESNTVGDDTPVLDELLRQARAIGDPATRSMVLQRQAEELRQQEDKNFLDYLLTPQQGINLLGAVGSLAAGNPALAAGIGFGGLKAADILAQEANAAKAEALEQNYEQQQTELDRLEKMHERAKGLVVANPEAFLTDEGEPAMHPVTLGWLTTGKLGFQFNPAIRRKLEQRQNNDFWQNRYDLAFDAMVQAPTEEIARRQATELLNLLDLPPTEQRLDDMVMAYNDPEQADATLGKILTDADPESIAVALNNMYERGDRRPLDNAQAFLADLTFEAHGLKASGSPKEMQLVAAWKKIREFMADPNNAETIAEWRREYGHGTDQTSQAIAQAALGDDPVLRDIYMDDIDRFAAQGISESAIFSSMLQLYSSLDPFEAMLQEEAERLGISIDDILAQHLAKIPELIRSSSQAQQANSATLFADLVINAKKKISEAGLTAPNLNKSLRDVFEQARRNVASETGRSYEEALPVDKIREEFEDLIDEIIANNQQ